MQFEESTALALEGPRDPFTSRDQAGTNREYEQMIGCSPTPNVALPGLERAAPTSSSARLARGTSTQFRGRVFGRNAFNTGQPERDREFGRIVGNSRVLEFALDLVQRVAPTQSAVLVLGETGSGKELIARAIHNRSPRYDRPFVPLNCAAIPHDLLESELFGHEKGAFTGAIAQKIGRFEMADTGTLFLDEVGDIPPLLQPKLLRVLQEQEFERIGSGRTHHVNVRIVAATNRNLEEMVARNEFRSDLYYRLNVFPIALPPLRKRQEDIPALVTHFVDCFSSRMGKQIVSIPEETMEAFKSYSWPGNIRELQNMLERAVILANDGVLPNPLPPAPLRPIAEMAGSMTLRDYERELILQTLEGCSWAVGGPNGAAARFGLKRTCLYQRIKRLGIKPPSRNRLTQIRDEAQLQDGGSVTDSHPVSPDVQHVSPLLHDGKSLWGYVSNSREVADAIESAARAASN
jgi:transcriptional regulator with GAF, ATPase, and Fis domain